MHHVKARRRVEETMGDPECGVTTLRRRARRVLLLHGKVTDERWDYGGEDYTIREWIGSGIRVTHDNRGDEVEVMLVRNGATDKVPWADSLLVFQESYGEIKRVDEALVDLANELIAKAMVLDELADS
jgi:hypothetical protein